MGTVNRLVGWLRDRAGSVTRRWEDSSRRREAGVRPGEKVRDGYADDPLEVVEIGPERADEYYVNGTPLAEHGVNPEVAPEDDVVVECRYPRGTETYAYPAARLRPLEVAPGDVVRDRFTGDRLTVETVRDDLASAVEVDDELLYKRGPNERLDCRNDWVVDCTVPGDDRREAFPLSRLAPGHSPNRPARYREQVTSTTECFSCENGVKGRPEDAACEDCTDRIMSRDGYMCQQVECRATDDLEIHHLYYEPTLAGEIPDRYLITLCGSCHDDRHAGDDSDRPGSG